jgi:hypothetical protein
VRVDPGRARAAVDGYRTAEAEGPSADIALMERAERAEPRMRGACAELRRRLAEQQLEQMRRFLHALEAWEPPPFNQRRPFAREVA